MKLALWNLQIKHLCSPSAVVTSVLRTGALLIQHSFHWGVSTLINEHSIGQILYQSRVKSQVQEDSGTGKLSAASQNPVAGPWNGSWVKYWIFSTLPSRTPHSGTGSFWTWGRPLWLSRNGIFPQDSVPTHLPLYPDLHLQNNKKTQEIKNKSYSYFPIPTLIWCHIFFKKYLRHNFFINEKRFPPCCFSYNKAFCNFTTQWSFHFLSKHVFLWVSLNYLSFNGSISLSAKFTILKIKFSMLACDIVLKTQKLNCYNASYFCQAF